MSIPLVINGISFQYPETGDTDWGSQTTLWANAVTSGMLQKAGGSFELTDDVDFGPNFGIFSLYFSSRGNQPAQVGVLRLTKQDKIAWQNTANDNHIDLGISAEDLLRVDGPNGGVILCAPQIESDATDITLDQTDYGRVVLAQTSASPRTVTLPIPTSGLFFTIKDGQGNASINNITIVSPVDIDGSSSDLIINTNWGWVTLVATNAAYFIVGAS